MSDDIREHMGEAKNGPDRRLATSTKALDSRSFRVQVRLGKYIFLAFFAGFNPGLTQDSCGQDTLVAT